MLSETIPLLRIKGAAVTLDALGCRKEVTERIMVQKAHYLIGLKNNRPAAYHDVEDLFSKVVHDGSPELNLYRTADKGHGRIEERSCLCLDIRIDSVTERNGRQRQEYRYYISNHEADARKLHGIIRAHWTIENALRYVLDMIYDEDGNTTRTKNLPINFSALRKIVLSMINSVKQVRTCKDGTKSTRGKQTIKMWK